LRDQLTFDAGPNTSRCDYTSSTVRSRDTIRGDADNEAIPKLGGRGLSDIDQAGEIFIVNSLK
jgi:hypothetical protein